MRYSTQPQSQADRRTMWPKAKSGAPAKRRSRSRTRKNRRLRLLPYRCSISGTNLAGAAARRSRDAVPKGPGHQFFKVTPDRRGELHAWLHPDPARPQAPKDRCYHLDRGSGRRRDEDYRRHPMIGHEGEPLDELLVGHHPIVGGRQHAIDALQQKGRWNVMVL